VLKGFDHIGLTCSNLEKSVAFYSGLLGAKEVQRGRNPAGVELVYLDTGAGILELFSPPGSVDTPAPEPPRNRAGFRHLALTVDDLDAAYRKLQEAGVVFTEPPTAPRVARLFRKVAFCLDPDGIPVELVERKT
jgi:glyoxylase I family protein